MSISASHDPDRRPLELSVGCRFAVESSQPAAAVLQVAPSRRPGVSIRGERWGTDAEHHGYIDGYGNRCERFELAAGGSQIAYSAQVSLAAPADESRSTSARHLWASSPTRSLAL